MNKFYLRLGKSVLPGSTAVGLVLLILAGIAVWAQPAAAQTTPYPGPRPTPTLAAGAAYPGGPPTAVNQPAAAYPVENIPVTEPTATPVPRVGNNPQPTAVTAPIESPPDLSSGAGLGNSFIMWAGFLLGLLIFLVAIYATIILYMRKQA
ncbi:MAG TPA: hypothetical protein EYH05_07655 [Anaerolineae bacterium]|nr:hypothetical protein [Anaerolineae bacterium]